MVRNLDKIFVRLDTIYALPIAKILRDKNPEIQFTSPSEELIEALKLTSPPITHHLHVSDLVNKSGILLMGEESLVTQIQAYLFEELEVVVGTHQDVKEDSIYLGVIEKITAKGLIFLDIGHTETILFPHPDNEYEQGEKILVQIKKLPEESDKLPVSSDKITLSGNYVVLEKGHKIDYVRISKRITGEKREDLFAYGKELRPDKFGIILRTSCGNASKEDIEEEIKSLLAKWEKISDLDAQTPKKEVSTGGYSSRLYFNYHTKEVLDKIRSGLVVSFSKYHSFKSYSVAIAYTLEFANNFVTDENRSKMEKIITGLIEGKDYPLESNAGLILLSPDGNKEEKILGNLKEVKNGFYRYRMNLDKRRAESDSSHYILYAGDYVDTFVKSSYRGVYYRYYSGDDNELIGERVQMVTPIDFYFRGKYYATPVGVDIYLSQDQGAELDIIKVDSYDELLKNKTISMKAVENIERVIKLASDVLGTEKALAMDLK